MSLTNRTLGYSTDELRHDARRDMRPRRGVVAASLVGIAAIGTTTLLQMGLVRRLPDPPIRRFETKRVNLSDEAFGYGGPDSPVVVLAHAINMVLASTGGADRAQRAPLVPLAAGAIA